MPTDPIAHGGHVMTVCNACRYCEQYCPVFPAMERRLTFAKGDLLYLANLCHNCGECLYACQYAPPHEFGIDVPRTFATLRAVSYEEFCWPRPLAVAFRRNGLGTSLALAAILTAILFALTAAANGEALWRADGSADFYGVVPHGAMIGLFGAVFAFAIAALAIGVMRFRRALDRTARVGHVSKPAFTSANLALRDILTLRHLHTTGVDCVSNEETRSPWRRWFHHATFYGFGLCFASTTVAAVYHTVFGWSAPYGYTSLPVLLGTIGGGGLLVGPVGLWALRARRDPALTDPDRDDLDRGFIALLLVTSLSGLALLALRHSAAMGVLLLVHLGAVLALFLTLPYGKFVHGLYRAAALVAYHRESADRA